VRARVSGSRARDRNVERGPSLWAPCILQSGVEGTKLRDGGGAHGAAARSSGGIAFAEAVIAPGSHPIRHGTRSIPASARPARTMAARLHRRLTTFQPR